MSTSIDQRVVEMRFDNAQFESGVSTSLSTLDRLKQALSFDGLGRGLENITKSANSINMDGLSVAVDSVGQRFSALETIATGALLNIGRQIESTATRMVKSLTIDNISAGFNEYELKMGSVQTIMAGTGASIDEVNKYLDELNAYSDRTIYSFSDMTNNIGKFTNAGVSLKDSVAAIQGVANVAAVSGANANQASHAMYNFAQALSSGYVKLIDWKSIEMAQMATVGFKEELLKTAESLGTVKKQADGTWKTLKGKVVSQTKGFNDSLQDQWMTTEVLTQTLARYSDESTEIGKKAAAAATEVKTFSMMIDTVKEAVGSSWAKTWELIFGDFEEGKQLWTGMEKVLEGMFVSGGDELNTWLEQWRGEADGGRKTLIEAFSNLYYDLKMVVEPIKVAFREVFGLGLDASDSVGKIAPILVNVTKKFKAFTEALAGDGSQYEKIREAARGVAIGFRILGNALKVVFQILSPIGRPLKSLANQLLNLAAKFGPFMEGVEKSINESEGLKTAIDVVSKAVEDFCNTLAFLIDNFDLVLEIAGGLFDIFVSNLSPAFQETKKEFEEFIKPFTDFIHAKFGDAFERLWSSISSFDFAGTLSVLGEIFTRIKNSQKVQTVINVISTAIQFLSNHVQKAWTTIKNFVNGVKAAFAEGGITGAIGEIITRFTSGFSNLKTSIENFFKNNSFIQYIKSLKKDTEDAASPFEKIGNAIRTFASQITPGKIAVLAFSAAILMLMVNTAQMFGAIKNLANAGSDFLGIFKSFTAKKNNVLLELAIVIGVLAGSLYVLAQLDQSALRQAAISLGIVVGVAGSIALLLTLLSKFDTKAKVGTELGKVALSMVAFAGAMAIMVLTLERLDKLKISGGLIIKLGVLVGVIGVLAIIGKKAGGFTGSYQAALTIVAFAASIALVVNSLVALNTLDTAKLGSSLAALGGIMLSLALLSRIIGSMGIVSAIGLIALVFALDKVLPKLEELAGGDYKNIKRMLKENVEIMSLIASVAAGMLLLASFTGGGIDKFGKGMLKLSAALAIMVGVVYILGKMDAGVAKRGTKALAGILAMFAVLELVSGVSSRIAKGEKSFTKGIVAFSFAALILVGAVAALGMLDPAKVKQGEMALAGVLGMLAMFELVSAVSARIAGGNTGGGLKGVIPLIIAVSALAIELIALSFVPWEDLKHGMAALAAIVGLLSVAMIAMGQLKPIGVLTFIETLVLLGSMVGALYILSQVPWENTIAAAASLSVLALGLSGALALLTIAGAAAGPALIGIGLLDIFLVDLAAIIALMGTFNIDAINKGIDVLNTLGFGLGSAIGNFVGGLGVGLTNGLPIIGANLSVFALTSKPFFDMMTGTDFSNIGTGIKGLADGLLAITANNFLETVVSGIAGVGSMEKFGQDLSAFGKAIVQYSDTVAGKVNEEAITSSVNAGKMLTELNESIPNSGGVLAELIGDNTFATLKVGLVGFGRALAEYSGVVAGKIDETAVQSSVNAGKMLAGLQDSIPNSGGKLADLLGDNTWASISAGLVPFGRTLVGFSNAVAGKIDETAVQSAVNAGLLITALAKDIPNSGGILSFIVGDNDFTSFGKNLTDFGNSIVKFSEQTKDIHAGQMSGVVNATRALVDIAANVASSGAGERGFSFLGVGGKNQFESFGKNLVDFAKQVQNFSKELSSVSTEQLSSTATSFKNLVNTLSDVANVDISGVTSFSASLEGLGHLGVQNFIMTFTDAEESVQTAITSFVGYFTTDLTAKATDFNTAGSDAIANVVTGMDSKSVTDAPLAATTLITEFVTGIGTELTQLEQAGADAVNGFINGVNGNLDIVRQIGSSMGLTFIDGVKDTTGWDSPWKTMIQAGADAANGLVEGAKGNENLVHSSGYLFGKSVVDGFREATGWYCTPRTIIDYANDSGNGIVEEMGKQEPKSKKAGFSFGKPLIEGAAEAWEQGSSYLTKKATELSNKIGDSSKNTANTITNLGKTTYDKVSVYGKGVEEVIESVTETEKENEEQTKKTEETVKAAGETVKGVTKTVKEAGETVDETKKKSKDYFDVMDVGKDVVEEFQRRYGAAFSVLGDTAPLEASKMAVEALAMATYEASKTAEEASNSTSKSAKNSTSKLEEIKKAFSEMRTSLTSTISGQMDVFKSFDKKTELTGSELLKNMQSQISGVTEWAAKIQQLAEKGIDKGLLKKLSEMGPQGYEYVNAFTQMTAQQLQQANQLFSTSLQVPGAAAVQVMSSYAATGTVALDGFINGLVEGQDRVNRQMENVAKEGGKALEGEVKNGTVEKAGEAVPTEVGTGIEANKSEVELPSKSVGEAVLEAIKTSVEEGADQTGYYACIAIAQAIEKHKDVIEAAAKNAGAAGNKGVTSEEGFNENSPSKTWYQFGVYAIEGLVNGLNEYSYKVDSASEAVGRESVSNLANTLNGLSEIDLGSDFTPTITPVLDLSEVRSGSKEINSIFSAQNMTPSLMNAYTGGASFGSIRNKNQFDSAIIGNIIGKKVDEALGRYTGAMSDAIGKLNEEPSRVNIQLEGDTGKIFKVVKVENDRLIKSTGFNPLGGLATAKG